jgi:interleukin-1 receptor-associated kinase 1
MESLLQQHQQHPRRYSYAQLKRMTGSFAHKLGQGGNGEVYKGSLPDGREVAVKMLKEAKVDGEEFINEVASISRTSHVNVVTLLGFCLEGCGPKSKRGLVYEYMPNGSLERYTAGGDLGWEQLLGIAVGIARGLEYLHRGCNTHIVHFDIKPHNILLDAELRPKISDFGLAKLRPQRESTIPVSIAGARGTVGYIAPEVFSRQVGLGAVTSKSDVYSYGMMVLEMVGVRRAVNSGGSVTTGVSSGNSIYFPEWLYQDLNGFCASACGPDDEAGTTEVVRKMVIIGLWCIRMSPSDRPTMSRVVEMLETATPELELPPEAARADAAQQEQQPLPDSSSWRTCDPTSS